MKIKYIFHGLFGSFLLLGNLSPAQSLGRQTICSTSGSGTANGVYLSQTVGQSYHTATAHSYGIFYRPGFQQSATTKAKNLFDFTIQVKLFPNPAMNAFTVNVPEAISDAVIQVTDISGRMIFRDHLSNFSVLTVNCADWFSGTYVVTVYDEVTLTHSSKQIIVSH